MPPYILSALITKRIFRSIISYLGLGFLFPSFHFFGVISMIFLAHLGNKVKEGLKSLVFFCFSVEHSVVHSIQFICLQFIFSTAIDGKIKAWLYDCLGSRVDYDAPGLWCTAMAYSADGTRFFF